MWNLESYLTHATVGMARASLVTRTRRTVFGQDVSPHGGCPLKVARGSSSAHGDVPEHHQEDARHIRHSWPSRGACVRQWTSLHQWRIRRVHQEERHTLCDECTLPSSHQWACREGSPDIQERHEEVDSGDGGSQGCAFPITPPHHTALNDRVSPAELLMSRRPRSHLDQLLPNVAHRVRRSQEKQKEGHDQRTQVRSFKVGDLVLARNFGSDPTWLSGCIKEARGPLSFLVQLEDGHNLRRHVDHLLTRLVAAAPHSIPAPMIPNPPGDWLDDSFPVLASGTAPPPQGDGVRQHRRSDRERRPPDRLFQTETT